MNNMLIVIPFCAADCALAEHLIDWIFLLNSRQQSGHCLLCSSSDVHPEMQAKLKLAAEVTFEGVDVITAGAIKQNVKSTQVNHLFLTAANHIMGRYKSPWLWLEPDCVPLAAEWVQTLESAYQSQPKRYYGSYVSFQKDGQNKTTFARTGIYPATAGNDLKALPEDMPFHVFGLDHIMPKAGRCRLIQQLNYTNESDPNKIRPEAVLLHSDKTGAFIADRREALDAKLSADAASELAPRRRGRPRKQPEPDQPLTAAIL